MHYLLGHEDGYNEGYEAGYAAAARWRQWRHRCALFLVAVGGAAAGAVIAVGVGA